MRMIGVQYTRPIIPCQNCFAFSCKLIKMQENTETLKYFCCEFSNVHFKLHPNTALPAKDLSLSVSLKIYCTYLGVQI